MKRKVVQVKDLVKTYVSKKVKTFAVRGISFDIYEGDFVALTGPSGSGKSTILYQLGLLDTPTKGNVFIDYQNLLKLSPKEKSFFRLNHIGYVFQHYELLPELTALENVALPLRLKVGSKKALQEASKLLDILELSERKDHYPDELSGGEQQRVAIARSLVNVPRLILADEPTANLDSVAGERIMKILKSLSKKYKKTILVVNHEKAFEKYFDKIIRIKDGELIKIEKK